MLKRLFFIFFLLGFWFSFPALVKAENDFKIIYFADYKVTGENDLVTQVDFRIQVINLRSDIYIKKFSLAFPRSFTVNNLSISDDVGPVVATVSADGLKTKIDLEFNHPQIGRGVQNNFYLKFTQENIIKNTGNIWEMILPAIENKDDTEYKISLTLPDNTQKKLALAKPRPTRIVGNKIFWDNPQSKTIYGIFGDTQLYQAELVYHLKNPNYTFVYTDLALPPDTAHQKLYLSSLDPQPKEVLLDEDGNYLARYVLNPSENKVMVFKGYIELSIKDRTEVIEFNNQQIDNQKKYLLNQNKYWKIQSLDKIQKLPQMLDIYKYVVNYLDYDYAKISLKNERLGAEAVLKKPDQAVCVEYSDLAIALARENGIYAREIQGYAFSQETELRPISFTTDVLHSWVEYYDKNNWRWIQVDPTWQDTSGIDYFNSLDLNHIAFAIHGKDDSYPLPAGMYKTDNSRDILIVPTAQKINENIKIDVSPISLPQSINDKDSYKTKIIITNRSNVFLYNMPIEIRADKIGFNYQKTIAVLAPLQKKELEINYQAKVKNLQIKDKVQIFVQGNEAISQEVKIMPYVYDIAIKVAMVIVGLTVIYLIIRLLKKS